VSVKRNSDASYNSKTGTRTVTLTKATPSPLVITSPTTAAYLQTDIPITYTGGSGIGAIHYSATGTACAINATDPAGLDVTASSGTCSISVSQDADTNYTSNIVTSDVVITRAAQTPITVTGPVWGYLDMTDLPITYVGGSGTGAVSYSLDPVSNACAINATDPSGVDITALTGTCRVVVTQAGDANYEPATGSLDLSVGVIPAAQDQKPLVITSPTSGKYLDKLTPVVTGGSGTGALTFTTNGNACEMGTGSDAGKLKITSGSGVCQITAFKDATYVAGGIQLYKPAQSAPVTVAVSKIAQAPISASASLDGTFVSPVRGAFGDALIPVLRGGSGVGAEYFTTTGTACPTGQVSGRLLITAGTGTCSITAHKQADANYLAVDSAPVALVISKGVQSPIYVTGPTFGTFGAELLGVSPTWEGGSSTGAVTFTASGGACSIDATTGNVVIDHGSGVCNLVAKQASDSNYLSVTSDPFPVILYQALQARLSITGPLSGVNGGKYKPTTTGGTTALAPTFTATGTACTVGTTGADAGVLLITAATGTCSLTAHMAGDVDYLPVDSAPMTVFVGAAGRATAAATTVVAKDAGSGSVNVTWNAPTVSTGITHYIATAWSANNGGTAVATCQTVGVANRACTITGLTTGTTYYVSVVTYVGASASPATGRVAVTPAGPPAAPTAVAAANVTGTPTSLRISWTAAKNNGSAITGSVATAWSAATGGVVRGTCNAAGTAVTCTIAGLARTTTYYVSVVSTNALGTGPASARITKATL
jgi:hypothetical protein